MLEYIIQIQQQQTHRKTPQLSKTPLVYFSLCLPFHSFKDYYQVVLELSFYHTPTKESQIVCQKQSKLQTGSELESSLSYNCHTAASCWVWMTNIKHTHKQSLRLPL